ncbi:MAG: FmdE family protein [Oscillospiraceae bacterium]|jgi:formylmethanofuran dehydrogenase subunit E|nr:FmdE family protein [Oscillospiraceae bacterium]
MNTFKQDLQEAVEYHGHLCAGQIIGVRMARMALKIFGIDEPKSFRNLIVYVECDRCLTDAIGTVTGCKLGRRNLKWMDYGKSAATFLNLETGDAIRITSGAKMYPPEGADLVEFFEMIKDEDMFGVTPVKVSHKPEDLPGKPLGSMTCPICGENVMDGRQVVRDGAGMCKPCAGEAYYVLDTH